MLTAGLVVVVALAVARFYPLAVLVSAVLLPVMFFFYMYATNVYESKPGLALTLTIGWGAVVGIVLGLFSRHIALDPQSFGFAHLADADVFKRVFILPIAAFIATIVAIVVLYLAPHYDELLDGIAFGATTAVTIAAAQTVVEAATLLHDGFRAAGAFSAWLMRLIEVALLVPISWAGGAALMAGALWLGGRVPVRDQRRVTVLANRYVASIAGILLFVAPEFVLQGLRRGAAFAALIGVALVALVLTRTIIHSGLLEEAELLEEPGGAITCANCDRITPRDLFCGRCGVALRALPKSRMETVA